MKKLILVLSLLFSITVTYSQVNLIAEIAPGSKLRQELTPLSNVLLEFKDTTEVVILDYDAVGFVKCSVNGTTGYVQEVFFILTDEITDYFKPIKEARTKYYAEKQKELDEIEHKFNEERKQSRIASWGETSYYKLKNGEYWLGMTKEQLEFSHGNPTKVNRTVGSWGIHEQWIYRSEDIIFYLEDDILTSFQD